MDQPKPSGSGEQNAKRKKLNIESDQQAADGDAVAMNEDQTADILKMDIDCCEEAFDYLPLEDLVSVGKTCKRMQQVAGHCFQQNYSGGSVHISKEGIHVYLQSITPSSVEHFAPFFQRIWIKDEYSLRYFVGAQSKFRRLKQIAINNLISIDMDCLKKISLGKLESLHFWWSDLSKKFHEIIDQCSKLKRLEINNCCGEFKWLNRKFSTLEHFKCLQWNNYGIESIPTFLELNPNIQRFETSEDILLALRDNMMTANIKLVDLTIHMYNVTDAGKFNTICDLLNALHERGFYRKLQLGTEHCNQERLNRLASLNCLSKFSRSLDRSSITMSALNKLEELYIYQNDSIADINELPNALINLKYLNFYLASIDDIMPFIRRSVEMQEIRVIFLKAGKHFNKDTGIIDLRTLNRERALLIPKQLVDIQKITLYVDEKIYLATKWASGETDFKLIRLKRYRHCQG